MMPQELVMDEQGRKQALRDEIEQRFLDYGMQGHTGAEMHAEDNAETIDVLKFYYKSILPKVFDDDNARYFGFLGTSIPVSNLSGKDTLRIKGLLMDHDLMRLKYSSVFSDLSEAELMSNIEVETIANVKMGENGVSRQLDKSFQLGFSGSSGANMPLGAAGKKKGFFGKMFG